MVCTQKPLVSVVMPAYNAERYIEKAIRSVQGQTWPDWELIVLDDCSSDRTAEITDRLAREDSRIRLYTNGQNLGVAGSRNRGLELCWGDYVAFLDSDDAWRPQKLELQLDCARKTGADLVYTSYAIVDAAGKKQCRDFLVPSTVSFEGLLRENVIGCSTVMLSLPALEGKGFQEDFFHEDYVLWLRLLNSGRKAAGVEQVLVDYFFHGDSKAGNKGRAARKRWNVYRRYLGLSVPKSMWYFGHYALAALRKYARI